MMNKNDIMKMAFVELKMFKDSDSGRYGKTFEIMTKKYLNGNRGNSNKVSGRGKNDVVFLGKRYEIKSNCGEINSDIMTKDYIIYSPDNKCDFAMPWQAFVMTPEQFIDAIKNCGLYRMKKSTSGYTTAAIQTYNNSKRKNIAWLAAIAKYPTLDEHITDRKAEIAARF